jgi:tRNA threonylcarbamoyladenosine biosynthesis protein TsaE
MEWLVQLNEIQETAKEFWKYFSHQRVFAFHGHMGAGKTTFIRALCMVKEVSSPITSPSFAIINEYIGPEGKIFHIDLFRINDQEEAIRAGVEECLCSGEICLVEWPEKTPGILPSETVDIYITVVNQKTRKIQSHTSV